MLASTSELLNAAQHGQYAIGAFNVYNLEGVRAVVVAAETARSPAILQVHPAALQHGGLPLVAMCLSAAQGAAVPMSVHLDHSTSLEEIKAILGAGVRSIMADGSGLSYPENIRFTLDATALAHEYGAVVEAELGRLSGTEDGLTVAEYEAKLTNPIEAAEFVEQTGIDILAVCIGNAHGRYLSTPQLDFERLAAIRQRVSIPLVLHGASGLPAQIITRAIELGVCKFNVNTEVRSAYVSALREQLSNDSLDVLELMGAAEQAMCSVILEKLHRFGSMGRAEISPAG
jgi:tagatose 1,6-diphosphate aldolase GatY/KbaY